MAVFRSLWGKEGISYDEIFIQIKDQGFTGVEVSLLDIQYEKDSGLEFTQAIARHKLSYIVGIYTSWQDYIGPWENKSIESHVKQFKDQIKSVSSLDPKPFHINVHAGSDDFTLDESISFLKGIQETVHSTHFSSISFETHRGRMFYSLFSTRDILKECYKSLPLFIINFTLDLSHWVIVSERLLESDKDMEFFKNKIVPNVLHIHTRVGTAQSPQVPQLNERYVQEIDYFEKVWQMCLNNGKRVSLTPEYGPEPYQTYSSGEMVPIDSIILQQLNRMRILNSSNKK